MALAPQTAASFPAMSPSSWMAMDAGRASGCLPREAGHVAGVSAVREVVRAASDIGLDNLTLFAFSSRELEAAQDGSGRPDGSVPRLFPQRSRRTGASATCACASSAIARAWRRDIQQMIEDAEKPHRPQHGPQSHLRVRLWRPGRDRQRRARTGPRRQRRPARSGDDHARTVRQRGFSPARCPSRISSSAPAASIA